MLSCLPGLPVSADDEPLKILAIGNSYSNDTTEYVSRIARGLGIKVEVTSLYYPGCTLKMHVYKYENDIPDYVLFVDGNCDWKYMTLKEVLAAKQYDIITFQQSPSGCQDFSTYYTPENPYLTKLADYVRVQQPNAKFMIHQTWAFCEEACHGGGEYTVVYYDTTADMFKEIEENYRKASALLGNIPIIPFGKAVQTAVDEFGYDPSYQGNPTVYNDLISHMNKTGSYLTGCVFVESIFGVDCRKTSFTDYMKDASLLQEIAHEVVTGEQSTLYENGIRAFGDENGVIIYKDSRPVPENGEVTIPTTLGGKTVTGINKHIYADAYGIQTVYVPQTVRKIDVGALDGLKVVYVKPEPEEKASSFPVLPVCIGGAVLIGGVTMILLIVRLKKRKTAVPTATAQPIPDEKITPSAPTDIKE